MRTLNLLAHTVRRKFYSSTAGFTVILEIDCFTHGLTDFLIFAENLVEHDLDVVAGVPVAVVIKAAGLFEDAGELHAARAQVVNVSLGVLVAVFKGALLLGLAPETVPVRPLTVVAVGVEGRVNVNQIHAGVGQLG